MEGNCQQGEILYVDQSNFSNLQMIIDQVNLRKIIFRNGHYEIEQPIKIDKNYIEISSENDDPTDVIITNSKINGYVIILSNCHHVTIRGLTLSAKMNTSIALTVENSNHTLVEKCRFFGGDDHFTVYYSGPKLDAGPPTLNAYDNDILNVNNIFYNNIIYSNWNGDTLAFSLQKFGKVYNNVFCGGKIAIYMVKDSEIFYNKIFDSHSHGIVVSIPSQRLVIIGNYIQSSTSSAINLMNQIEHGPYNGIIPIEGHQIVINANVIEDSKHIGIELTDANTVEIKQNVISNSVNGIYLHKSKSCKVYENNIKSCHIGIAIDVESENNLVSENKILSYYPVLTKWAIVSHLNTSDNKVTDNSFLGQYSSNAIEDFGIDNTFLNNVTGQVKNRIDNF